MEKGIAPDKLIATKFVDDKAEKGVKFTRPLCAYPEFAKYEGAGDTNEAASFLCVARLDSLAGVRPPRALYTPEPEYSKSGRELGRQGIVVLNVVVGIDGRIHSPRVVRSLSPSADDDVMRIVKTWKFSPATAHDHPVGVEMNIEVAYEPR